jgi:polysaccharide biosynthesis protein PslJ
MTDTTAVRDARSAAPAILVTGALGVLAAGVISGVSLRATTALVVLATVVALVRPAVVRWPKLIAALILVILFIPIRRYTLPGSLPFQLEPYRIFVMLLVGAWFASLLVDRRTRLRSTGFEGPIAVIVSAALLSIVANPGRVQLLSSEVQKALMFFLSFVLVAYIIASVIRRVDNIDYLAKALVAGGAVVAFFAIVEARTGVNVFNHLDRVLPGLTIGEPEPGGFQKFGTASVRVFASAQHPIALSAALVMLAPLAVYLATRYRQRRWWLCALLFAAGCASTVSRTGILMFVVVGLVFLWLRPTEVRRLWPALLLAPIVIHFALPGTLGALKHSFFPAGGLVAEQESMAGESGSGRLADIGPALHEWKQDPLLGVGFGTRVIEGSSRGPRANILDNQWLGTLIETGAVGIFGWLWFFVRAVRRFGGEAKRDDSARGWLLASIAAGVAAYGVGMLTFDAFSFIQVTFLLFIFVGLGSAVMAERPTPVAVRTGRTALEAKT